MTEKSRGRNTVQPPFDAVEAYRRMMRIRLFETTAADLHQRGEFGGTLHLATGQEGEIVGACMALERADYMLGNHRSHGHPIGKGADLKALMAELYGRATGICKGKGGSMHLADFSVGSLGESSIVGSGIPVATGAALGAKMQKSGRVALCFFGDGASSEGTFHESLNLAAVWKLPVIYLCENNGYAITVSAASIIAVPDIAIRAQGYGIPGVTVDGQDVVAVHAAMSEAVARAKAGDGPTLIEAKTYRFDEHAANMGRIFEYRPPAEVDSWRTTRDPIKLFRAQMTDQFGIPPGELDVVDAEVRAEVDAAVDYARASPMPDAKAAFEDLFAQ